MSSWVSAHATGRAIAWLDDDLGPDIHAWAAARSRTDAPALLAPVDAKIGVRDRHVKRLLAFAASAA